MRKVTPDELKPYDVCHFFSGIGGWPLALQLAGWNPDRPVWTGSCPCQPFSTQGKRKGNDDERNIWPVFFNLIKERRSPTVFGEQIESAIGFGWLDRVFSDLEKEGYACAAAVLPASGAGAPHCRYRLFWVASDSGVLPNTNGGRPGSRHQASYQGDGQSIVRGNANVSYQIGVDEASGRAASLWDDSILLPCIGNRARRIPTQPALFPVVDGLFREMGNFFSWVDRVGTDAKHIKKILRVANANRRRVTHGAGNAIVPQIAAQFIMAFMDTES